MLLERTLRAVVITTLHSLPSLQIPKHPQIHCCPDLGAIPEIAFVPSVAGPVLFLHCWASCSKPGSGNQAPLLSASAGFSETFGLTCHYPSAMPGAHSPKRLSEDRKRPKEGTAIEKIGHTFFNRSSSWYLNQTSIRKP